MKRRHGDGSSVCANFMLKKHRGNHYVKSMNVYRIVLELSTHLQSKYYSKTQTEEPSPCLRPCYNKANNVLKRIL